ncbi:MAG: hypothetical protein JWR19_310 [Pedosphaera sp.]|nr:hypothetical protein [Pedosphaera sp.]
MKKGWLIPLANRRIFGVGMLLLLTLVMVTWLLVLHAPREKPVPPLSFDTNAFIASKISIPAGGAFPLPTNPSLGARFRHFLYEAEVRLSGPSTWSFPASAQTGCSVQGLLDECTSVSGTRYLMPIGVAAGSVQFGNTNTLDGPHWVAAFEEALRKGPVNCWDPETKTVRPEQLVLLRFPAQKTVVVLPVKSALEFQRTNGLPMPGEKTK